MGTQICKKKSSYREKKLLEFNLPNILFTPLASEFLIRTLESKFRIYSLSSAINCAVSAKQSWHGVSGNHCLVPWSVIPVDTSDSFDTILDAVRAGNMKSVILR